MSMPGWMFNFTCFDIERYNSILSNGLSHGLGSRESGEMCIEAAVCYALGLEHGDDPKCVSAAVRNFKISLNDSNWSSPAARAEGLRELGIAQLGSLGQVDDAEFSKRLAEKTIKSLILKLFREVFPDDEKMEVVALRCEIEGTQESAAASYAASYAAKNSGDEYLKLSAQLALATLREMKAPGVEYLDGLKAKGLI